MKGAIKKYLFLKRHLEFELFLVLFVLTGLIVKLEPIDFVGGFDPTILLNWYLWSLPMAAFGIPAIFIIIVLALHVTCALIFTKILYFVFGKYIQKIGFINGKLGENKLTHKTKSGLLIFATIAISFWFVSGAETKEDMFGLSFFIAVIFLVGYLLAKRF